MSEIKIGSSVKVNINRVENMWIEVTEINGSKIKGKIDEHPIKLEEVEFGDFVEFEKDNVINQLD